MAKNLTTLINEYGAALRDACDKLDKASIRLLAAGKIGQDLVPEGMPEGVAKSIRKTATAFAIQEMEFAENGAYIGQASAYARETLKARKALDVEDATEYAKLTAKAAKASIAQSIIENDGRNLLSIAAQRDKLDAQAARGDAIACKTDMARLLASFSPSELRRAKLASQRDPSNPQPNVTVTQG